jgi:hypothetical protein
MCIFKQLVVGVGASLACEILRHLVIAVSIRKRWTVCFGLGVTRYLLPWFHSLRDAFCVGQHPSATGQHNYWELNQGHNQGSY